MMGADPGRHPPGHRPPIPPGVPHGHPRNADEGQHRLLDARPRPPLPEAAVRVPGRHPAGLRVPHRRRLGRADAPRARPSCRTSPGCPARRSPAWSSPATRRAPSAPTWRSSSSSPAPTRASRVQFATHLYVTSDVAMAAGREMGGYPKKIADIRIEGDPSFPATLERPAGERLVLGHADRPRRAGARHRGRVAPEVPTPPDRPQPDPGRPAVRSPNCS